MSTIERLPDVRERFASLKSQVPPEEYNFRHFRRRHLLIDAEGTVKERGIRPGEAVPDFELPRSNGGASRLSESLDRPLLLHFGSPT